MAIRGFDPSKVERKHIRPITIVYGDDAPGISLRMSRFISVLNESGDRPCVFSTAADAADYIAMGDMFSDSICVAVQDASDMVGSDTESKNLLKRIGTALRSYDEDSTFVFGIPTTYANSKAMSFFIKFAEEKGGIARRVEAPVSTETVKWIAEYAKSRGLSFASETSRTIGEACCDDIEIAQKIMDAMGEELNGMSSDQMVEWINTDKDIPPYEIRDAMLKGDIVKIEHMKNKSSTTASGYRTFVMKARSSALDLLLASFDGDISALQSFKAANQYKAPNISALQRLSQAARKRGDWSYWLDVYQAIDQEAEYISGMTRISGWAKFLANVAK